jgi:hypothetical protein
MAVGWPTKTTYLTGDVYQASDVNDTNGTLNLLGQSLTSSSGKNALYNSGFDIAQRGTSFTGLAGTNYTLDRWMLWSTTGGQSNYASQESAGNLSVSPNQAIRYCGRFGRTSGTSNTGARQVFQTLETADSVRFAGQTISISFYARRGANYSATSNVLGFGLRQGTGTDQIYYAFTGGSDVINTTATLTTSWQRFTATATVATTTTQLAPYFFWTPTGTAGAADYIEITGVQLESGTVTSFARNAGTIQGELAACQRYFQRFASGADATNEVVCIGQSYATTASYAVIQFLLPMRVTPTMTISSAGHFAFSDGNGIDKTCTTLSLTGSNSTPRHGRLDFSVASGLTVGQAGLARSINASSTMDFSSEL